MPSDWDFAAPPTPTFAYLVVDSTGLMDVKATLDSGRAHEFARNTGSVVVTVLVTADFRKDTP